MGTVSDGCSFDELFRSCDFDLNVQVYDFDLNEEAFCEDEELSDYIVNGEQDIHHNVNEEEEISDHTAYEGEQSISIAKKIDSGVLGIFVYNGFRHCIRLNTDSRLADLTIIVCKRWSDINPMCIKFEAEYGEKRISIRSDEDIISAVVGAVIMCIDRMNVYVSRTTLLLEYDVSCAQSSSDASLDIVSYKSSNDGSDLWKNAIIGVGQTFISATDFRSALRRYTIYHGYGFIFKRNLSTRIVAECSRKLETLCDWRIVARKKYGISEVIEIRKFVKEHTCGIGVKQLCGNNMSSEVVRSVIGDIVRDRPKITPAEVIDIFRRECGVTLSYYYAHKGIELSLRDNVGDEEGSYQDLRWYIENLKSTNPDSYVHLDVDPVSHRFKRLFVCFEACIYGVKYCRKVIALDGCHLKSKYQGCMLSATTTNGDGGMFPVAMGIVNVENNENWEWFLLHLRNVIGDATGYTFISDRHNGLIVNVPKVFPYSDHSYCLWHLKNNFKTTFPARFRKRKEALALFSSCARSMTDEEYETNFEELVNLGLRVSVNNFFSTAPIEHWVNAFFPGRRYGMLCSNIAESFNSWISKERELPICSLIDHIRIKLMDQMSKRRENARTWKTVLCPSVEKKLVEMVDVCSRWKVVKSTDYVFEVFEKKSHNVNLFFHECTCNEWRVEGFPCKHAVVCILADRKFVYDFCDPCFLSETYRTCYSHPIYPIPTSNKNDTLIDTVIPETDLILPPDTKRGPGRPKMNRYESTGVFSGRRKKRKCGRCNQLAYHNKKTCKASIVVQG